MSTHRQTLEDLVAARAPLMPGALAATHASLEWRASRRVWLDALQRLGLTEDQVRRISAAARAEARGLTLPPVGSC